MTYCNAGPHFGISVRDINMQSIRTLIKMNSRKKVGYGQGIMYKNNIGNICFYNMFICIHMR